MHLKGPQRGPAGQPRAQALGLKCQVTQALKGRRRINERDFASPLQGLTVVLIRSQGLRPGLFLLRPVGAPEYGIEIPNGSTKA